MNHVYLTVRLLAEVDLPHVAGQVGGPYPAVAPLLVDPGVEVGGRVTHQGIGHQQEVEPLEEHHHGPAGQGLAETFVSDATTRLSISGSEYAKRTHT